MSAKHEGPCYVEGCDKEARRKGLCTLHYQRLRTRGDFGRDKPDYSNVVCSAVDCKDKAHSNGLCRHHYNAFYSKGTTENTHRNVRNKGSVCSVDGCEREAKKIGLCHHHYQMKWKYGRLEKLGTEKTDHPLYGVWIDKQVKRSLCERWQDFWLFVEDVKEKPIGNFRMERLTDDPFGPNNFEWRNLDARKPEETQTEWRARQWQTKMVRFPDHEVGRHLENVYGITRADYAEMMKRQNGVCWICKKPETSVHRSHGKERVRNLAVDHNHKTGDVRALLCMRCNHILGRGEESVDIFQGMINYIREFNGIG